MLVSCLDSLPRDLRYDRNPSEGLPSPQMLQLFEFVASQLSNAFRANNVKSGTGVIDAAERSSWAG
jgi:hypothetical protein